MGLNFRKSINLGKGFKLNIGKKSVGISGGVKGARISMNSSGRKTLTLGIPGTGLSYSINLNKLGKKTTNKKKASADTATDATADNAPTEININGLTLVLILVIVILLLIIAGAAFAYFTGII